MTSAPSSARGLGGLDRGVVAIASVVVLGAIMSILDTTIVNVALETLGRDFHASVATIQWVVTGYMLSLAVVIPLTGWAAERFGAKRLWMTSVVLFVAGSALCGIAWSTDSLIGFRVLQGFGGGMVMPAGMTILAQAAGPERIGRVMSIVGVPMLLGPVLGPVLGGVLVDDASWRWIFYVNLPIGAAALVAAARLLPRDTHTDAGPLDWRGFLLLSPGLAGFTYGLAEISEHGGLDSTSADIALVAGVALIVAFVRHALGHRRPLLDMKLFRTPAFGYASATSFLLAAGLFGSMILIPLYYQGPRAESALTAGLLMAPQGLGAALAMVPAGKLTDRIGGGRVAVPGVILVTIGTVAYTQLTTSTSYALLSVALLVRGIGMGFSMMPAMAAAYATLDRLAVPRATSALNVVQRVGGSIGTAVLAVVLQRRIAANLGAPAGGGSAHVPSGAVHGPAAEHLAHAFGQTFWGAVVLTALTLLPAVLLARGGHGRSPRADEGGDEDTQDRAEERGRAGAGGTGRPQGAVEAG